MNKRSPKGSCNNLIREAIAKGLHLEDGVLVLPSGKPARIKRSANGYNIVSLGPSNKRRSFTVGRIVCWLTHGEPKNDDLQADHINRVRWDDRPENLRWFSASENASNVSDETKKKKITNCFKPRKRYRGENCSWSKLNLEQVKEIKACNLTQSQLAIKFKVSQPTISRIQNGKRWQ